MLMAELRRRYRSHGQYRGQLRRATCDGFVALTWQQIVHRLDRASRSMTPITCLKTAWLTA